MTAALRFGVAFLAALVLVVPAAARAAGPSPAGPGAKSAAACPPEETRSEVPALTEFHTVIARLWHEAWPNRQVDTLRAMLPDIEAGAAKVAAAKLPGILHERQGVWDAGVRQLETAVAEYAAAARGADDQKLLDAGEALHSRFEGLVRITRPALKELDAFHAVLYRLYHYDLPAGDRAAIRASVANLAQPMAALNRASLAERLKAKRKDFEVRRRQLSGAVDRLATIVRSNEDARIRAAVEEMHARYQALAAVFD